MMEVTINCIESDKLPEFKERALEWFFDNVFQSAGAFSENQLYIMARYMNVGGVWDYSVNHETQEIAFFRDYPKCKVIFEL